MDDFGFEASVWASPNNKDGDLREEEPGSSTFSALSPSTADRDFDDAAFGDDEFEFNAPMTGSNETNGDDFDDFEEGNEDDDFDDFEDGFQQAEAPAPAPSQGTLPQQPTLPFVSFLDIILVQIINNSCSLYPILTVLTPKEL